MLGGEGWTSFELSKLARVTLRQLGWWRERRIIYPDVKGIAAIYRRPEALRVMLLSELRRKGVGLATFLKLRRIVPETGFLVIIGRRFVHVPNAANMIKAAILARSGITVMDLAELAARLDEKPPGTRVHLRQPVADPEAWMR